MQQVDVQRVTVDPLPAVQQPAQLPQGRVDRHPARVFDGVAGTDLVGDRADPAYPRGDVGRLGVGAPTQERLEESGRLVDVEFDPLDGTAVERDMQCAFAFHTGQRADGEGATGLRHSDDRSASNWVTLKVAKIRSTSPGDMPSRRSNGMNAGMLGVAVGPKHP